MGYQADFGFDITILAKHVEAAEVVAREHLRKEFGNQVTEDGKDISNVFRYAWGQDLEVHEESPAPLLALASGSTRGDIRISGYVNKKWRDWEEPLMDELAPFIEAGGIIRIDGEDDYRGGWSFDGKTSNEWSEVYIDTADLKKLEEQAKELEIVKARLHVAEALLREAKPRASIALDAKITAYFKEPSPLEQLAKVAE
jgi:hypothetical protein